MLELTEFKAFHQIFEQQVANTPNAPAILYNGEFLTYQAVNQWANQLANYLHYTLELPAETRVGLYLEQAPDISVSILGVMKADCAYVPLDPGVTMDRLLSFIDNSQTQVIVTQQKLLANELLQHPIIKNFKIICIEQIEDLVKSIPEEVAKANLQLNIPPAELARRLAYIIYTSGSTGKPKGVAIEHISLPACMDAAHNALGVEPRHRIGQYAPLNFDAHLWQIMLALGKGACLYLIPPEIRLKPRELSAYYKENNIDIGIFTPSLLIELNPDDFNLEVLLTTGEMVTKELLAKWFDKVKLIINGYGPVEDGIATSYGVCGKDQGIHIGKPFAGKEIFILNERLQPVAPGEEGEVIITGVGLARGYWGKEFELLNQERFLTIPHPYNSNLGSIRVYRTRDTAKFTPEGNIVITGRLDRQVKVYGQLVLPEEIEYQLRQIPQIKAAYIDVKIDCNVHPQFNAYLVLNNAEQQIDFLEIRNTIATFLPAYMLPASWAITETMPITINGKVDVQKLREIPLQRIIPSKPVAPRDEIERQILELWKGVLDIEQGQIPDDVHANFMHLGGTSLKFASLLNRLASTFPEYTKALESISFLEFSLNPTVAKLARLIQRYNDNYTPLVLKNLGDKFGLPLFYIHDITGNLKTQVDALKHFLGDTHPVYGLQPRTYNVNNPLDMDETIQEIAFDYLKAIQQVYPSGPYVIIAWSGGGSIAVEIVRLLQAQGKKAYLYVIDAIAPEFINSMTTVQYAKENIALANTLSFIFGLKVDFAAAESVLSVLTFEEQVNYVFKLLSDSLQKQKPQQEIESISRWLNTAKILREAEILYQPKGELPQFKLFISSDTENRLNIHHGALGWRHLSSDNCLSLKTDHFEILKANEIYAILSKDLQVITEQNYSLIHNFININLHKENVRETYQQRLSNVQIFSDNSLPFEQIYGELNISKVKIISKPNALTSSTKVPSAEELTPFDHKASDNPVSTPIEKPLRMERFFPGKATTQKRGLTKLLFVGESLSTVCKKFVASWLTGDWGKQFEFVFWIDAERIIESNFASIAEVISQQCFNYQGDNKELINFLSAQLNFYPEKYLFIVDNFDHVLSYLSKVSFEQEAVKHKQLLTDLLKAKNLIVTAKSHNAKQLQRYGYFDALYDISGFTEVGCKEYLKKFFASRKSSLDIRITLAKFLTRFPSIKALIRVPANLEIICSAVNDVLAHSLDLDANLSFTTILEKVVNKRLEHFLKNFYKGDGLEEDAQNLSVKDHPVVLFLERLGYESFVNNDAKSGVFDEGFLMQLIGQHCHSNTNFQKILDMALLTSYVKQGQLPNETTGDAYAFVDIVVARFFAAKYLSRCLADASISKTKLEEVVNFISSNKYNYLQKIIPHVAGLLKNQPRALQDLFDIVIDAPVDIFEIFRNLLFIACLNESYDSHATVAQTQLILQQQGIYFAYLLKHFEQKHLVQIILTCFRECRMVVANYIPTLLQVINVSDDKVFENFIKTACTIGYFSTQIGDFLSTVYSSSTYSDAKKRLALEAYVSLAKHYPVCFEELKRIFKNQAMPIATRVHAARLLWQETGYKDPSYVEELCQWLSGNVYAPDIRKAILQCLVPYIKDIQAIKETFKLHVYRYDTCDINLFAACALLENGEVDQSLLTVLFINNFDAITYLKGLLAKQPALRQSVGNFLGALIISNNNFSNEVSINTKIKDRLFIAYCTLLEALLIEEPQVVREAKDALAIVPDVLMRNSVVSIFSNLTNIKTEVIQAFSAAFNSITAADIKLVLAYEYFNLSTCSFTRSSNFLREKSLAVIGSIPLIEFYAALYKYKTEFQALIGCFASSHENDNFHSYLNSIIIIAYADIGKVVSLGTPLKDIFSDKNIGPELRVNIGWLLYDIYRKANIVFTQFELFLLDIVCNQVHEQNFTISKEARVRAANMLGNILALIPTRVFEWKRHIKDINDYSLFKLVFKNISFGDLINIYIDGVNFFHLLVEKFLTCENKDSNQTLGVYLKLTNDNPGMANDLIQKLKSCFANLTNINMLQIAPIRQKMMIVNFSTISDIEKAFYEKNAIINQNPIIRDEIKRRVLGIIQESSGIDITLDFSGLCYQAFRSLVNDWEQHQLTELVDEAVSTFFDQEFKQLLSRTPVVQASQAIQEKSQMGTVSTIDEKDTLSQRRDSIVGFYFKGNRFAHYSDPSSKQKPYASHHTGRQISFPVANEKTGINKRKPEGPPSADLNITRLTI